MLPKPAGCLTKGILAMFYHWWLLHSLPLDSMCNAKQLGCVSEENQKKYETLCQNVFGVNYGVYPHNQRRKWAWCPFSSGKSLLLGFFFFSPSMSSHGQIMSFSKAVCFSSLSAYIDQMPPMQTPSVLEMFCFYACRLTKLPKLVPVCHFHGQKAMLLSLETMTARLVSEICYAK